MQIQVIAAKGTPTEDRNKNHITCCLHVTHVFLYFWKQGGISYVFGSGLCTTVLNYFPVRVTCPNLVKVKSTVGWCCCPLMIAFTAFLHLGWEQILRHSVKFPSYSSLALGPLDLSRNQQEKTGNWQDYTDWVCWVLCRHTDVYITRGVPWSWTAG